MGIQIALTGFVFFILSIGGMLIARDAPWCSRGVAALLLFVFVASILAMVGGTLAAIWA